jgi:hypothetical protein
LKRSLVRKVSEERKERLAVVERLDRKVCVAMLDLEARKVTKETEAMLDQ